MNIPTTRQIAPPLYFLSTFERSGYDDSDFFDVVYDALADQVRTVEVGTTRFAGPRYSSRAESLVDCDCWPAMHAAPSADVLDRAERAMVRDIFRSLRGREDARINEPCFSGREQVRFLKAGKSKDKKTGLVVEWKAGALGQVFWAGWFGTFYRNGYKSKGRHNQRVGVSLSNGDRVFVAATALILNDTPKRDDELLAEAKQIAARRNWLGAVRSPAGVVNML